MKPDYLQRMSEALRLTQGGDLLAATAAIQAALRGADPVTTALEAQPADVIDIEARVVPTAKSPASAPGTGRFIAGHYAEGGRHHDYKLYVPTAAGTRALPLIVMLHGCTQNPDDFAAGTAMNELAELQGFFVLYPAQSPKANPQRCWNWFKHSHQQRGRGEPAWLAGLTQEVMAKQGIDPNRVYVAGLSAGGAMAAVLGEAYPELYAAVGVHSGLAAGAAIDLPAAMAAMQRGADHPRHTASGVPTIVFHGDADSTVHASNGAQVVAASVGAAASVERHAVTGAGRTATRHVHRGTDGRVLAEHWVVHGAPHAWSGGSAKGSYTDRTGPDASAEMVRFFNEHPR
jgi:poly(hydroxyalkanoate) depolymerase family esterase